MNKVYLIGNLTRDPELTTTNGGVSVCRFAIAVTRRFSNADGERETDFFNITAWRGTAENCAKFLKKGNKVAISGSIQIRNFERQDGTRGLSVDITADDVEFLTSRNDSNGDNGTTATPSAQVSELQPVSDDDLPF